MTYSKGVFFRLTNNQITSWQQELEFINSLSGLNHVELWIENTNLTDQHFNWLNQNLSPYTKIIHAAFIGFQPLSFNQPMRRAAAEIIDTSLNIAQAIDAKLITLHLGSYLEFDSPPSAIARAQLPPHPLLSIENMPRKNSWQRSAFCLTDLETYWPNFSTTNFTLDIGHCLKSDEDYLQAITNHHTHIKNIHLHDGTKNKDHQPLGTGTLQLNFLLKLLDRVNYTGFLTLETIGHEATKKSWQILNQSIQ